VSSPAAARILLRPEERRFLEPFLGRELSAAQAARELGLPVEQLAYRVRALTAKGLVQVTRTVPRKGRAVTMYRVPTEIRASLDLLPYEDVRGFFSLVDSDLREVFLASPARSATTTTTHLLGLFLTPAQI
jgi:predicted ArsR family transcriptional regulator